MTIKITGLRLEKDYTLIKSLKLNSESNKIYTSTRNIKLKGLLKTNVKSEFPDNEYISVDVEDISKKLQEELYTVLNKIEDEINSRDRYKKALEELNNQYEKIQNKIEEINNSENSQEPFTFNITINHTGSHSAKDLFEHISKCIEKRGETI